MHATPIASATRQGCPCEALHQLSFTRDVPVIIHYEWLEKFYNGAVIVERGGGGYDAYLDSSAPDEVVRAAVAREIEQLD